jgi:hypothetical protein
VIEGHLAGGFIDLFDLCGKSRGRLRNCDGWNQSDHYKESESPAAFRVLFHLTIINPCIPRLIVTRDQAREFNDAIGVVRAWRRLPAQFSALGLHVGRLLRRRRSRRQSVSARQELAHLARRATGCFAPTIQRIRITPVAGWLGAKAGLPFTFATKYRVGHAAPDRPPTAMALRLASANNSIKTGSPRRSAPADLLQGVGKEPALELNPVFGGAFARLEFVQAGFDAVDEGFVVDDRGVEGRDEFEEIGLAFDEVGEEIGILRGQGAELVEERFLVPEIYRRVCLQALLLLGAHS